MQHHSVEQLTHALTEHLRAEQAVAAALVFGSAVTERMHAESDLDVALLLRDEYEREALNVS
jgi:predicted nucleotidyltransferase